MLKRSRFEYQAEKFAEARRSLMLPHPVSEAQSISEAFLDCSLALAHLDRRQLDDRARLLVVKLEWFMNTSGVADPAGRGTWLVMAERFDEEEKEELARVVDELAHWFGEHA